MRSAGRRVIGIIGLPALYSGDLPRRVLQSRRTGDWMAMGAGLEIRVQPRASGNDISALRAGKLRVRVTAPPVAGRANAAAIALLAQALDVPKSAIRLVKGASSRDKTLEIQSLSQQELNQRLNQLCA